MTLKPRRRFLRFFLYVVSIVLVLIAIDLVLVQIRRQITPGYETTRISGPLLENGRIDYLTAIEDEYSRGVTDENNAAPLLLEAFGRTALPRTQPPDGITDRLHMRHLPEAGDYLISLDDFRKTRAPETQPADIDVEKWPPPSDPTITDWLRHSSAPLQKVRDAGLRSRYFMPMNGGHRYNTLFEVLLPHLNLVRQAAVALSADALYNAQAGQWEAVRADLLATHRLARLTAQGPTLVERMVSDAIEVMACKTSQTIATHAHPQEQTAREVLADLRSLPELPGIQRNIDVERYLGLDLVMQCAREGPVEAGRLFRAVSGPASHQDVYLSDELFRFIPIPYAESMQAQNMIYDGEIVALSKGSFAERKEAASALESWCDMHSRGISSVASPYWLLRLILPAFEAAQVRLESARAQSNLTQITWALAAYHAQTGAYPDSPDVLVPQYLTAVPKDNFVDAPFRYAKDGSGYALYSVGPNMVDDHGANSKKSDDIDASNQ